jgi:hypothetical protein
VYVIVLLCLILTELITRLLFHDKGYYLAHRWPVPGGLLFSGLVLRLLMKSNLNETNKTHQDWYISRSSDESHAAAEASPFTRIQFLTDKDTFYLIPLRLWPWILSALALVLFCFPIERNL